MELKLAWATFPTHVAALAAGRTVVGLGPYVPFAAASFAPGSLFWLVPSDPDTELREHYRPAYQSFFDQAHMVCGTALPGPLPKRLEVCARVHAVLARLSPQDGAAFEALDRLGDEIPWTAERLRELAHGYGAITLFVLEVARASMTHTLLRRVPVTSQLGVRPLDPGALHPVLPPEALARRVAAIRAVLAGPAGRLHAQAVQPGPGDHPAPARAGRAPAGPSARPAELRLAERERTPQRWPAGAASKPQGTPAPVPGDATSGTAGNGTAHAAGGLEALKQRIAADVLLPAEWSAELQEFCDLALESPRHAVAACRRLLQHVIAAAHAVHCRGRSAVGFQARADDLRNAGCISDLSRRWLLALWDIGTAALHEEVRGWGEQDTEAVVLGTWRVLSAERQSLAVQPHQALAADTVRRNGKQHATDTPPDRSPFQAAD